MFCKKCGTEIRDDSVFCFKCGTQVAQSAPDQENTNPQPVYQPSVQPVYQPAPQPVYQPPVLPENPYRPEPRKKVVLSELTEEDIRRGKLKQLIRKIVSLTIAFALLLFLGIKMFTVRVFLATEIEDGGERTVYEYDRKGNVIEETVYRNSNKLRYTKYEYTNKNLPLKEVTYSADGEKTYIVEYDYSDSSPEVEVVETNCETGSERKHWVVFDNRGNIAEEIYRYSGFEDESYTYQYTNGKRLFEGMKRNGASIGTQYGYQGKRLVSEAYDMGDYEYSVRYSYSNGKTLTKKTYNYYAFGYSATYYEEFVYDSDGHLKRSVMRDEDENLCQKTEYKCDQYGNVIEKVTHDAMGDKIEDISYEYTKKRMFKRRAVKLQNRYGRDNVIIDW